jgi:hypothetical protein
VPKATATFVAKGFQRIMGPLTVGALFVLEAVWIASLVYVLYVLLK